VRPPRFRVQARVGSTIAHEGGPKSHSRHDGLRRRNEAQVSFSRNGPYRWKAPPIGKAVAVHAAPVESISAALARENPREGVIMVHLKPEREKQQGCQRLVASAARADNIPSAVASFESEANAARQSGETGVRVHLLLRSRGGSQSPSFLVKRKFHGSTGNQRVRVVVVESLGSRHRTNASVVFLRRGVARRNVARGT